jgi:hypothetical protein
VRFDYYRRLSRRNQAIYRESDEWGSIELDRPADLHDLTHHLGAALAADDRVSVEKLTARLVTRICRQLNVPSPSVRVEAERPRNSEEELHGLYIRHVEARPELLVWMRTAVAERPVAKRAYLRTLMHEVCHHLDYDLLDLADSFHTHGFFERESSLLRQLVPAQPKRTRPARAPRARATQLKLPW